MSSYKVVSTFAPNPNTERGKATRLTSSPDGEQYVYASGNSIIIRNARNPMVVDVYNGHKDRTTVARIAPSGYYCCSADIAGNVMVWDTTNKEEHIVKYQKRSFANGVFDISWTEDSKRICVVGNGKEHKAEAFMWDSGSSVGEIGGHTQPVLGCSFRPKRPYRLATCGEDSSMNFYQGPPFKFVHSNRNHARFVNTVEYSPNGDFIVSGGGDKKMFLYDGTEGKLLGEFTADEDNKNQILGGVHKLSVLQLAFTRDSAHLWSASTDKTVKLWDVATRKYLRTFIVREATDPKQIELADTPMGITYTNYGAIACTLRGDLVTFDDRVDGNLPVSILRAPTKRIESLNLINTDPKASRASFIVSSLDGQAVEANLAEGYSAGTAGFYHDQQPCTGAVESNGVIASLGINNTFVVAESPAASPFATVFQASPSAKVQPSEPAGVAAAPFKTPAPLPFGKCALEQPRACTLLSNGEDVAVISTKLLSIFPMKVTPEPKAEVTLPLTYEPKCIVAHKEQNIILVGGQDQFVHFYKYDKAGKKVTEYAKSKGKYAGAVVAVAISPDGKCFAASRDRFICLGPTDEAELNKPDMKLDETRLLHTATVNALDFSADGKTLLSAGSDCQVLLWATDDATKFERIQRVHAPLGVTQAKFLSATSFITSGPDAVVRVWSV